MSKTFDLDIDNTSDHQPVVAKLDHSIPDLLHGQHCPNSTTKQKIHWSNISQETVNPNLYWGGGGNLPPKAVFLLQLKNGWR